MLDPTGQYLVFPDLGGNLIHVYCIDPATGMLAEHTPLKAKPKYGPRHAVFWTSNDSSNDTFLFVIHELRNRVTSYKVTYLQSGGLDFTDVDDVSTYGKDDVPIPDGAAASEIVKVRSQIVHTLVGLLLTSDRHRTTSLS